MKNVKILKIINGRNSIKLMNYVNNVKRKNQREKSKTNSHPLAPNADKSSKMNT